MLFQTHACAVIIAGVCLFVTESFWNFARSTAVILSYSVQNFKTIWLNEKSYGPTKFNEIWANKVITVKTGTFDVSITDRCSSEEIIQVPQGIWSAIFNYVDGSVNWNQINMKRKTTCLTLYSTLWLLMAYIHLGMLCHLQGQWVLTSDAVNNDAEVAFIIACSISVMQKCNFRSCLAIYMKECFTMCIKPYWLSTNHELHASFSNLLNALWIYGWSMFVYCW